MDPGGEGFLGALRNFDKSNLRKTTTAVTTEAGERLSETRNASGDFVQQKVNAGPLYGFVVDPCADLQVGEILPGLILGSQDIAVDEEILEKYNVTHVLNVATFVKNTFPDKCIYKNIDIMDIPKTDIIPYFEESFDFINEGRESGCVLVHCNAGVSRSATIVIAYLMKTFGLPRQIAYDHVKTKRPKTNPNAGFQEQLVTYEKQLAEAGVIDLHSDKSHTFSIDAL